MELTPTDIARMIDISAVQAQHGEAEVRELVHYAKKHNFIAVHALPCWTKFLSELLHDREDILVGGPIGFPSGGHKTETKVLEAKQLIADGAREIDLMLNVGMLRSERYDYVENEIKIKQIELANLKKDLAAKLSEREKIRPISNKSEF